MMEKQFVKENEPGPAWTIWNDDGDVYADVYTEDIADEVIESGTRIRKLEEALKQTARQRTGEDGNLCWCIHWTMGATIHQHDIVCAKAREALGVH